MKKNIVAKAVETQRNEMFKPDLLVAFRDDQLSRQKLVELINLLPDFRIQDRPTVPLGHHDLKHFGGASFVAGNEGRVVGGEELLDLEQEMVS